MIWFARLVVKWLIKKDLLMVNIISDKPVRTYAPDRIWIEQGTNIMLDVEVAER